MDTAVQELPGARRAVLHEALRSAAGQQVQRAARRDLVRRILRLHARRASRSTFRCRPTSAWKAQAEGTFEHTLIIAEEGSEINYIEGCTAQSYSLNSMHSAVVEIFVKEGAKARYTTVQNWSKDVYNLNTKRAIVEAEGTVEWVGGSMGAKYVMLYPGSYLVGEHARADHLNVGVAGEGVWKDTGAKVVHNAPNTTSNILAKSISKDGGIMGYRGLVRMGKNSQGSKSRVQCDGLMMDDLSRSDTWPDIQIQNPYVTVAHEAVVGKISDEQLFYLRSRGLTEDEAAGNDRQRIHRAGHQGAPDGVRGRAQPPDPA